MENNSKSTKTSNNPTFIQIPASLLKDAAKKQKDEDISLGELWYLCLGHWHWFLISVLICLSAATLYILRTPKSYTRMMAVLIKSDQQKDFNGAMGDFTDIGLIQGTRNVNNEIIAMTSYSIAMAVAKEMELTTSYQKPGFFKNTTLYDSTLPIRVVFCDLKNTSRLFNQVQRNPLRNPFQARICLC